MLKITTLLMITYLLLQIGCGCGKEKAKKIYVPGEFVADISKTIENMADEDILVSIDDRMLTLKKYNKLLKQFEIEQGLRYRDRQNAQQQVKVQLDLKRRSLIEEFADQSAVLLEAERLDLTPSTKNRAQVNSYTEMLQRASGKEYKEFCELLGYTVTEFDQKKENDALRMTLRDTVFTNDLSATAEELQSEKERYANYNKICEATNQLVMVKGAEIVQLLREGADFKEVAAQHSEMLETEDTISELTRSDIDELEVRNAAFSLPIGSISDPLDTERGLFIIKVIARNEVTPDTVESGDKSTVTIGRILLRLGEFFPCPTEDELKEFIGKAKRDYVYRQYLNAIRDKCRVEYPNGTNFWDRPGNQGIQ